MLDVDRRRSSGVVWASLADLVLLPLALTATFPLNWYIGYWLAYADLQAFRGVLPQRVVADWPRPLAVWVCEVTEVIVMCVTAMTSVCAGLAVYHQIVYREAFRRARLTREVSE